MVYDIDISLLTSVTKKSHNLYRFPILLLLVALGMMLDSFTKQTNCSMALAQIADQEGLPSEPEHQRLWCTSSYG
jgi:hypothetical protein